MAEALLELTWRGDVLIGPTGAVLFSTSPSTSRRDEHVVVRDSVTAELRRVECPDGVSRYDTASMRPAVEAVCVEMLEGHLRSAYGLDIRVVVKGESRG